MSTSTAMTPSEVPVLAVISNAGSTQNKAEGDWIASSLANESNVHVFGATGPAEIGQALAKAAAVKADIVVVNGGDGTADMVFAALLNEKPFQTPPLLALLPAGKTNMTAAAWCGAPDKRSALRNILAARRTGALKTTAQPILTVDIDGGTPPLRGAFFGAADVVDGILFCRRHIYPLKFPNAISHALAVSVLLWRSLLARADAAHIEAQIDDAHESGPFFFLGAMTLSKLILGLSPQPTTGSGGLYYMSLRSGVRAIWSAIPRLITKSVPSGYKRTVRRAAKLTLAFDGAYTLDGELFEAKKTHPITITASESLSFIDTRGA